MNTQRPAVRPGMKRKLQFDLGCGLRKGDVVTVDCMRRDRNCATGFRVRVVTMQGEHRHLDASWIDARLAKSLIAQEAKPK